MSDLPGTSPGPTPEQRNALDISGASVALGAGAGCGKTFVLTGRFLRALEGPEPTPLGRLVALTFTNKAARELRDRIRRECRSRLESGADPTYWRGVIRGLSAARIGTFHSFCGEVLRRHAITAGIDPGFTVLDEPIAQALRDDALSFALRERLAARDPDLMELAVDLGLGAVRQALAALLANRSGGDIRDWAGRQPHELVNLWLGRWTAEVRPALIADFHGQAGKITRLVALEDPVNDKIRLRMADLGDAFARLRADPEEADATLRAIVDLAKVQGLGAKLWPSAEVYEAAKEGFGRLRDEARKLREILAWDERATLQAAVHGLRLARLAGLARDAYDRAKRARGGLDNDDLLILTRDLLACEPEAVGRPVREGIDLVLVDEFQDTDPVQAEILEALGGPEILDGRLFLVGDFKQSIYRFRGAQPGIFQGYRGRFTRGRLDLTENFRSVPAVLDFVNALFAETFADEPPLVPGVGSPASEGPPAVAFVWGGTPAPGVAGADADSRRGDEARRLARYLKHRLDGPWMVRDKGTGRPRRAVAGDLAFLFRSLSDASAYESALVAEGLDYHVVGGSGFFAQQEVSDIINVLTAVEDPLDAVALAGTLRSPFFSISDDALFWLATERKGAPHAGLQAAEGAWLDRLPEADRPLVARARQLLTSWRGEKDRVPIASLLDKILGESGYEAALLGEFLGDRKRANARKLVRMARRFDEEGGFTLADFVGRLRADLRGATKETQAATTDEAGEVIRLMSIHQAKGLEFPIVILPDLDRKRPGELRRVAFDPLLGPLVNPAPGPGEVDGEDEPGGCLGWTLYRHQEKTADDAEALRLFYVATTRARDYLILSSANDPGKPPTSPALALLDRRFDRSSGALREPGRIVPRVEVVEPVDALVLARSSSPRSRPRLPDVARVIHEGATEIRPDPAPTGPQPRLVELDPTLGLPLTSARLDRLVRSILADPRSADPRELPRVAERAARRQSPVAHPALIARAVELAANWARSPLARDLAAASEILRDFAWSVEWSVGSDPIIFQGRGDVLRRESSGEVYLALFGPEETSIPLRSLRVLLSARASLIQGFGAVTRATWIPWEPGGQRLGFERFDDREITRTVLEWLSSGEVKPGGLGLESVLGKTDPGC